MKLDDLYNLKSSSISFEFFPPKGADGEAVLFNTVESLSCFEPDYVSITYGAGGSTSENTLAWSSRLHRSLGMETVLHLTCIAQSYDSIDETLDYTASVGIENILALRGDIPSNFEGEIFHDFKHADDLIKYIRSRSEDICIGAAVYPEGHKESPTLAADVTNVKRKVDAGASFLITQLFFDNNYFYDLMNELERQNIDVPVVAGIMPITNIKQVVKFTDMCGVQVGENIMRMMEGRTASEMEELGVEFAVNQCRELLEYGVRGLHFFTLNKNSATEKIVKQLKA